MFGAYLANVCECGWASFGDSDVDDEMRCSCQAHDLRAKGHGKDLGAITRRQKSVSEALFSSVILAQAYSHVVELSMPSVIVSATTS